MFCSERFPHKPYIKEGFPKNVTVLVNSTAKFQCEVVSDMEPFLQWMRVSYKPDDDDSLPTGTEIFEVRLDLLIALVIKCIDVL